MSWNSSAPDPAGPAITSVYRDGSPIGEPFCVGDQPPT